MDGSTDEELVIDEGMEDSRIKVGSLDEEVTIKELELVAVAVIIVAAVVIVEPMRVVTAAPNVSGVGSHIV